MVKNCCTGLSFFQLACVLILTVAVPFCIVMVITYILGGIVWREAEDCNTLCCFWEFTLGPEVPSLPNSTVAIGESKHKDDDDYDDDDDDDDRKKRSLDFLLDYNSTEESYLPVIALLEQLHVDDRSYCFKCTAAVISESWALTTAECAKKGISTIRIGSKYWSKGGVFLKIDKILYPKEKQLLALVHFMKTDITGVKTAPLWSTKKLFIYNWKAQLQLPLSERKKNQAVQISNIEPERSPSCSDFKRNRNGVSCFVISKRVCESGVNAPLFNERLHLVGFYVESFCPKNVNYSIVTYIDVHSAKSWIYKVLE